MAQAVHTRRDRGISTQPRNRRRNLRAILASVFAVPLVGLAVSSRPAQAQLYWDVNGNTLGAGGPSAAGAWDNATSNWTTDSTGQSATQLWTNNSAALFSAGTDATGAFTVAVSGTQTASAITFEEGSVALNAGTVSYTGATITALAGATGTVGNLAYAASGTLNVNGGGQVNLSAATNITSGYTVAGGSTLGLTSASQGTTPGSAQAGFFTLNSGTLFLNTNNVSLAANKGVTLGNSGGTINVDASRTWTIAGIVSGTGGSLTKTGPGMLLLSNGNNSWGGKANVVNGGTLSISTSAFLGNTPTAATPAYITLSNGADIRVTSALSVNSTTIFQGNKGITLGSGGGTITLTDTTDAGIAIASNTYQGGNTLTIDAAAGGHLTEFRWVSVTGSNTYSKLVVASGFVRSGNGGADSYWGAVPTQFTADQITLGSASNTGWMGSTPGISFNANRGITLAAGGGGIDGTTGATQTFNGAISGTGSLTIGSYRPTVNFNAFVVLTGSNTYSGNTILGNPAGQIGSPKLQIGNGGTTGSIDSPAVTFNATTGSPVLFFARSNNLTYAGTISGPGTVTQAGSGQLWLTGTNTYTTATTFSQSNGLGGIIVAGNANALPTPSINVTNSNMVAAGYPIDQAFMDNLNSGSLGVGGPAADSSNNLDLSAFSTLTFGAVGTVNYSGTITNVSSQTYQLGGGASGAVLNMVNSLADLNASPTSLLIGANGSSANTTVVLNATNTFTGTTTFTNGGILRANDDGVSLPATNVSIQGGVLEGGVDFVRTLGGGNNQVQLIGGGTTTTGFSAFGAPVTVSIGGMGTPTPLVWGSNVDMASLTLNAPLANNNINLVNDLDLNSGSDRAIIVNNQNATMSGAIANNGGGGGLIKSGAGALVLTNTTNSYTGNTTITAGTLRLGANNVIPDASVVVTSASSATLDMNNNNETITALAGNGKVVNMGNLTINGANTTATFSGTLSGSGTFTKTGSGTQTLTGNSSSTYSGKVVVDQGVLAASQNGSTGGDPSTGPVSDLLIVRNGATYRSTGNTNFSINKGITLGTGGGTFDTSSLLTINGAITASDPAAGLTKVGSSTLLLFGTTSYTGGTNISAGTLQIGNNNQVGSLAGAITNNGGTLTFARNDTYVQTGVITGTGATNINNGTLQLGADNILSSGSTHTLGANAVLDLNGHLQTIGALAGNGTTILSAALDTGGNGASTAYYGSLTGTGALSKSGTGTFTLSGVAGGYSGTTTVGAGVLKLSGNPSYTSGPGSAVSVNAAGNVVLDNANASSTPLSLANGTSLSLTTGSGLRGELFNIKLLSINGNTTGPVAAYNSASTMNAVMDGTAVAQVTPSTDAGSAFNYGAAFGGAFNSATNFVGRWNGNINIDVAGSYTFSTRSDDGSMMFIDGSQVVFNNNFQGATTKTGTATLTAGQHSIEIGFFQGTSSYFLSAGVTAVPGGSAIPIGDLTNSILSYTTNNTIGTLSGASGSSISLNGSELAVNQTADAAFNGTIADGAQSGGTLTKSGANKLTLNGANSYTGATTVNQGILEVATPSSASSSSAVVVNGGEYRMSGAGNYAPASLTINAGKAHLLAGRDKALSLASAPVIGATGQLDLEDSAMIVNYAASDTSHSVRDTIRNLLKNGRNGAAGQPGAWNGLGGISSTFANAHGNGFNLAIGYGDNEDIALVRGSGSYTSFGGQTVASNTVLVQMTRGADATLDGVVDAQDVTILGSHFNKPGSGQWVFGDFDYSGTCDATDVTTLGSTFGKTTPTLSPAQMTAEFGSAFTQAFEGGRAGAVPEPASLTLLGLGGVALIGRRRRKIKA